MTLEISTDPARLDLDFIHHFLSVESYWDQGITRDVVERSLANSLCFGAYLDGRQVGLARVVSDFATFAYVADVFIDADHRGRGYSKALMQAIVDHPRLQGLRRMLLATRDAHGLYAQYGFVPVAAERWMERRDPNYPRPR